jgi:hypothetical protein
MKMMIIDIEDDDDDDDDDDEKDDIDDDVDQVGAGRAGGHPCGHHAGKISLLRGIRSLAGMLFKRKCS